MKDWEHFLGIIEADGNFLIQVSKEEKNKVGYAVSPRFQYSQKFPQALEVAKEFLKKYGIKSGITYAKKTNTYLLYICNLHDNLRFASFLSKLKWWNNEKHQNFLIWHDCLKRIHKGEHYSLDGLKVIYCLALYMNQSKKGRPRKMHEELVRGGCAIKEILLPIINKYI